MSHMLFPQIRNLLSSRSHRSHQYHRPLTTTVISNIMDSKRPHPAFASLSSFSLKSLVSSTRNVNNASNSERYQAPTMVTPKHIRRTEEIKRLTKQLEELRAVRDQMKKKPSPSPSAAAPQPPAEAPPSPPVNAQTSAEPLSSVKLGKHSENSRFLSVTDFSSDQYLPRILPVLGPVPGLTVAELDATPRMQHSKRPKPGNIYVTKVPEGYRGRLITAPMSSSISEYADPIALQVQPKELSASQLPCADDDYVYVVLDRATNDIPFDNTVFYAWDVDGMVKIGWAKEKPAPDQARCLGRVALGILEVREELRKKRSCWEEENETYM